MGTIEGVLDINEEVRGDVLLIKIKGRLDAISSPAAEKRVFECIHNGHEKLLLDFSNVVYLSSAGMRMLLSTTKKLKAQSGKLVVCSINGNVMDVLKMSGFDHILEIASTQEEGLRKF